MKVSCTRLVAIEMGKRKEILDYILKVEPREFLNGLGME